MAKNEATTKINPAALLENWAGLNAQLGELTEEECWHLLALEKTGLKRLQFLLRIYGRANKLRTQRERQELVNK